MRIRIGILTAIAVLLAACNSPEISSTNSSDTQLPEAEYQSALIDCAADFGFVGSVEEDGGVHFSTTKSRDLSYWRPCPVATTGSPLPNPTR